LSFLSLEILLTLEKQYSIACQVFEKKEANIERKCWREKGGVRERERKKEKETREDQYLPSTNIASSR
jgi:hypothetical protein